MNNDLTMISDSKYLTSTYKDTKDHPMLGSWQLDYSNLAHNIPNRLITNDYN